MTDAYEVLYWTLRAVDDAVQPVDVGGLVPPALGAVSGVDVGVDVSLDELLEDL